MKTDWNAKLIGNYPLTFRNNPDWLYKNMECSSGWMTILERLFDSIESYLHTLPKTSKVRKNLKFMQIKEKFAGLRVYVEGADEHIFNLIEKTEQYSQEICELCGLGGSVCHSGNARFRTLCPDCMTIKGYQLCEKEDGSDGGE